MDAQHYKINQLFMSWIGQWPEQSAFKRFFLSFHLTFVVFSQFCLLIFSLVLAWQDWNLVVECSSPIMIHLLCFIKYINHILNNSKFKSLFTQMKNSWRLATFDAQIQILTAYTNEGKKLTKMYAVTADIYQNFTGFFWIPEKTDANGLIGEFLGPCSINTYRFEAIMYGSTFMYMTLPVIPSIVASLTSRNQTQPHGLLYNVQAVLDTEKYYYFILLHSYYTTFFLMTIPVATDSMLILYVQHACGLFQAIGYQLENMKPNDLDINICPLREDDEHYHTIIDSAVKHKKVLQFVKLLASSYSICFLILTVLNVAVMTFSGVQAVNNRDQPTEAFRFLMAGVCLALHFLFMSLPGQKLIDHSSNMYESIYATNWYAISLRARKLLNVMLVRCKMPCQMTAGKMRIMSLRNFSGVVQASMSYFTVLTSVQ